MVSACGLLLCLWVLVFWFWKPLAKIALTVGNFLLSETIGQAGRRLLQVLEALLMSARNVDLVLTCITNMFSRVDHLYTFFVQWSPDVYGKDAKEQGFVVVEKEELNMIDNFFSEPTTKSWEVKTWVGNRPSWPLKCQPRTKWSCVQIPKTMNSRHYSYSLFFSNHLKYIFETLSPVS